MKHMTLKEVENELKQNESKTMKIIKCLAGDRMSYNVAEQLLELQKYTSWFNEEHKQNVMCLYDSALYDIIHIHFYKKGRLQKESMFMRDFSFMDYEEFSKYLLKFME